MASDRFCRMTTGCPAASSRSSASSRPGVLTATAPPARAGALLSIRRLPRGAGREARADRASGGGAEAGAPGGKGGGGGPDLEAGRLAEGVAGHSDRGRQVGGGE